ncbi:MAG: cytochrome c biogenesis protein CcsA [Elusimicrobiales bacterium]|jgi:ABC-type transport system involved in cytochrome c biogenesis permease subunit
MMEIFQKASFVLYGAAAAAALAGFIFNREWKFRRALAALAGGWVLDTVYLALRWHSAGRAPLSNQYESLSFLLWAFIAVYLLFFYFSDRTLDRLAPWAAGLAVTGAAGSSFLDSGISPLVPALQSNWLLIHVGTVMAGYGAFTLSFLVSIVFIFAASPGREAGRGNLDSLMYRSALVGFWLLSMGIITGAVWANSAWGSYWSWDPKETWSLLTWLYYAAAIHLRRGRGWTDMKFARLMAAGFVLVMFTYFGVNYLLPGLHSYS